MHPILFQVPFINLPIYSYGVMLGLSLVLGWYIVMYLGKRDGFPEDLLSSCFIVTAICALLGSRILYIVTNWSDFQGESLVDLLNVRKGGLVAYGGFLGGFFGAWAFLQIKKVRILPFGDLVAPGLGAGLGITRLGCFLYGCDYGRPIPADAPAWLKAIGITFPNWEVRFPGFTAEFHRGVGCMQGSFFGAPAFAHHVSMELVSASAAHSALVYPTQLMEVLNGWVAFGLTLWVRRHTTFRGQAFLVFAAYYGITRALMEMLRGDTQRGGLGSFSTSQFIGLVTCAVAIVAWFWLAKRAKTDPIAAMALGPGAAQAPAPDQHPEPQKRMGRSARKDPKSKS